MNQRRYHRASFPAPTDLIHHGITYRGRLENISLRGAMIGANECILIPSGDSCTLSICLEEGDAPLVITAEVVHFFFSMVGVKFVDFPEGAELRLFELMKTITGKPEELRQEWEEILAHRESRQEAELSSPMADRADAEGAESAATSNTVRSTTRSAFRAAADSPEAKCRGRQAP
jgi:hypothetical protein